MDTEFQYIDSSLAQWKHRYDFSWFALTSVCWIVLNESSTKIPWKVDYLFTAVVLKMKMCLISGYWISVHRFKSCTMKASEWLQLVRFVFGMLEKLNESSTKIPWKVDYLVTAVGSKNEDVPHKWILNFSTSIQVLHNESIGNDFSWFALTSVCWIYWMKVGTKIPWKVDYLFTAGVLKMKMCLISGNWISVLRFKSCTMKASL